MRDFKLYILLALCSILCSCERIAEPDPLKGKEIKLFAKMGVHLTATDQTKGDGTITSSTDTELGIGLVRLDGNNTNFVNCGTPLTATLGTPDSENSYLRTVEFDSPQFFQNTTGKVRYAAWYPNDATYTGEGDKGKVVYSSENEGTTITFPIPPNGDSDIMYSNVAEGDMSNGFEVMQFNHALSLFNIYAYSSTSKEKLDWGNITSLTLKGMPDVCTITLPNGENGHKIAYTTNSGIDMVYTPGSGIGIPVNFNKKVLLKQWIAAPAEPAAQAASEPAPSATGNTRADEIKMLNISVTTANGTEGTAGNYEIPIARNFKPGYAYNIVLRFSAEGVVDAQVEIAEWPDGGDIASDVTTSETFYNLSANGTSNCYIVSSANFNYCFDATVKGNGTLGPLHGTWISPVIENPKSVKVIWCDNTSLYSTDNEGNPLPANLFKLETGKIVEGKVLFRVIGKNDKDDKTLVAEGNVLLGVYDENEKCLWTWHIWITDKPLKQNYKKGYIALDRNLGATASSPEKSGKNTTPYNSGSMNGLFYQWGRPTPFHIDNESLSGVTVSSTRVTPDEAVANPLVWYGSDETITIDENSFIYHDWLDRSGTFKDFVNNLWGYQRVEHEKPVKTLYDPCPHGYHVPYARTWEMMENYWDNKPASESDWENLPGIKLRVETEGTDIWYPFQGYINKDGVYNTGHIHIHDGHSDVSTVPIVEMWSSLINRHDADDIKGGIAGTEYEKANDSPYRMLFTKDYGAMLSDQYSNRSRGLAVRCVSNNTADVVKDLSASQTANCYMVHEEGYYKFRVNVRGNGVGSLLPLGGTTTAEINGGLSTSISPKRVDILWWQGDFKNGETDFPVGEKTSTDAPDNMCLKLLDDGIIGSDGYVAFQISEFRKGNVILAAYDEIGKILWTWHIWLTDRPADKQSGNYTKMDRFLGATFAPDCEKKPLVWESGEQQATLGFYYQWGRKDPIIGPPDIKKNNNEALGNENASSTATEVKSSGWWKKEEDNWVYHKTIPVKDKASIPEVVKDPTAFYRSTSERNSNTSQWFPDSFADGYTNVAMWGYAVADYSIEGQTFSKTMYDPCPPGYRTPFHFSWRYDSTYKYAEGDLGEAATTLTDYEKGYDYYGIVTNKDHFEKMWFPFAGYRNPLTGGYTNVGTSGYMHTGMPMGQYNTRTFWYNSYQTAQNTGDGSAYGRMIRCMKE